MNLSPQLRHMRRVAKPRSRGDEPAQTMTHIVEKTKTPLTRG